MAIIKMYPESLDIETNYAKSGESPYPNNNTIVRPLWIRTKIINSL